VIVFSISADSLFQKSLPPARRNLQDPIRKSIDRYRAFRKLFARSTEPQNRWVNYNQEFTVVGWQYANEILIYCRPIRCLSLQRVQFCTGICT
jgi:hypothetical protein